MRNERKKEKNIRLAYLLSPVLSTDVVFKQVTIRLLFSYTMTRENVRARAIYISILFVILSRNIAIAARLCVLRDAFRASYFKIKKKWSFNIHRAKKLYNSTKNKLFLFSTLVPARASSFSEHRFKFSATLLNKV